ncbi:MAG: 30S ribosomal protein S18 [Anaerolineales bacterium]|nr:30S ribosomal protein S18 [Anaerolineales bacterium]
MSDDDIKNNDRRGGGGGGGKRFYSRPKVCMFCNDKAKVIDYKNKNMLDDFVTIDGKIRPRRQTGTCAKHQRKIALAVKRARHIALLPFVEERVK